MPKTRKTLVMTLVVTFEGDYIPADQAEEYLTGWVVGGLDDRDDLQGCEMKLISLTETDPSLEADSRKLTALEAFGVDNWGGYSIALQSLEDEDNE
jgi:hypothetical protein